MRTFGSWQVRAVHGSRARVVPLEPKRLALFAYLAVEHGRYLIARESLMALFWPEIGERAARSALRQSLHYLASRLGPEVIAGRGTAEVGVEPAVVRCDAVEFERLLDVNEPARALRNFTGTFLRGFFYERQSHAFEEWVENERARLTERAFDAALSLAEEEAERGNVTGQVHWLKRALHLEPFREEILRKLVDVYEEAGSRATAIQAIRGFARYLRSHYKASISTQTQETLKRLQRDIEAGTPVTRAQAFQRMQSLERDITLEMGRTVELVKQLRSLSQKRPISIRGVGTPLALSSSPWYVHTGSSTRREEEASGSVTDKSDPGNPRQPLPTRAPPRVAYDVIAMASSAGGIRALSHVISGLPADLSAAVVIVQHLDPDHESHLSRILARETSLRVKEAEAGERIEPGGVYVAPPNHHLLIDPDGSLSLTRTEFVHFVRPSADLLFESVAASYGDRAIAVVLSGSGVDGSRGVTAIRKRGGIVIAQDEKSSEYFGMPAAAIRTGDVSRVLPLDEIAPALIELANQRVHV